MSEETPIDDCASGAGGGEDPGIDAENGGSRRRESTTGGLEGSDPDAAVEPARATYGWESYDCARCGSAVDRVWRGEEGLVCPDCKEW